jgi:hypothetical protein
LYLLNIFGKKLKNNMVHNFNHGGILKIHLQWRYSQNTSILEPCQHFSVNFISNFISTPLLYCAVSFLIQNKFENVYKKRGFFPDNQLCLR